MSSQFALDLRLARKKAGYTQGDVAHLLNMHQTGVSRLEHGEHEPDVDEIVTLSLLYGRSFDSYFAAVMDRSKKRLSRRLSTLPTPQRNTMSTFNRPGSLARLKRRLAEGHDHGGT